MPDGDYPYDGVVAPIEEAVGTQDDFAIGQIRKLGHDAA